MTNTSEDRIILGIDPGTNVMGYGAVLVQNRQLHLIDLGAFRITTAHEHIDKLKMIYNRVNQLITRFHPTEFAIESPFYGKNVQSMLKLGRAQGVALSAALNAGLHVSEYSPKKIKKAITGNGNASKEQVCAMLPQLIKTIPKQTTLDATDALAVAICHSQQNDPTSQARHYRDWKSYINQNQKRVKK